MIQLLDYLYTECPNCGAIGGLYDEICLECEMSQLPHFNSQGFDADLTALLCDYGSFTLNQNLADILRVVCVLKPELAKFIEFHTMHQLLLLYSKGILPRLIEECENKIASMYPLRVSLLMCRNHLNDLVKLFQDAIFRHISLFIPRISVQQAQTVNILEVVPNPIESLLRQYTQNYTEYFSEDPKNQLSEKKRVELEKQLETAKIQFKRIQRTINGFIKIQELYERFKAQFRGNTQKTPIDARNEFEYQVLLQVLEQIRLFPFPSVSHVQSNDRQSPFPPLSADQLLDENQEDAKLENIDNPSCDENPTIPLVENHFVENESEPEDASLKEIKSE
jgi:hypothetical protein